MSTQDSQFLLEPGFEETFRRFRDRYKPADQETITAARDEFRVMFFAGANYLQDLIAVLQEDAKASGKHDVFVKACVTVEKECKAFKQIYPEVVVGLECERIEVPKIKQ